MGFQSACEFHLNESLCSLWSSASPPIMHRGELRSLPRERTEFQGLDKKKEVEGTGQSSPPPPPSSSSSVLGGCRGGVTPVHLSGRGCGRADVSVRVCFWACQTETKVRGKTEWEPEGENYRDQEGVRERARDFCGISAWPTGKMFKKKDSALKVSGKINKWVFPCAFCECNHSISVMWPPPPVPPQQWTVSGFLRLTLLSSLFLGFVSGLMFRYYGCADTECLAQFAQWLSLMWFQTWS